MICEIFRRYSTFNPQPPIVLNHSKTIYLTNPILGVHQNGNIWGGCVVLLITTGTLSTWFWQIPDLRPNFSLVGSKINLGLLLPVAIGIKKSDFLKKSWLYRFLLIIYVQNQKVFKPWCYRFFGDSITPTIILVIAMIFLTD